MCRDRGQGNGENIISEGKQTEEQPSPGDNLCFFCSPPGPAFCGTRHVTVGSWTIAQFSGWKNCLQCMLRGPSLTGDMQMQHNWPLCCIWKPVHTSSVAQIPAVEVYKELDVGVAAIASIFWKNISHLLSFASAANHLLFVVFCISYQPPVVWTVTLWSRYREASLLQGAVCSITMIFHALMTGLHKLLTLNSERVV